MSRAIKFRKKPVVIEAVRFPFDESTPAEFKKAVRTARGVGHCKDVHFVATLEGIMEFEAGDWIIKGVKGEFYPRKADIFEMTHEAVT